jgi:hypothetical protein
MKHMAWAEACIPAQPTTFCLLWFENLTKNFEILDEMVREIIKN